MAKWVSSNVLDNGLNYIKNNCDKMLAVINYTAGDSYATVTNASNIVAEVTMAPGDFTLASSGNNRTLTTASGKSDSSANNTGDPTHIVFVKTTATTEVLWATDETSAQTVTAGNPVNFPSLVYTSNQPT